MTPTTRKHNASNLMKLLKRLDACPEGREWAGDRDIETAWNECQRGEWMLWFVAKINIERTLIVKAAALCAQTALVYVPIGEDRPRLCVEAVLRWADDPTEANLEAVRVARKNAYAAAVDAAYAYAYADSDSAYADAAAAYAAAYAAAAYVAAAVDAAADAVDDAVDVADAAAAAAYAAAAYADADADAAAAAARMKALARCADIVRETIPLSVVLTAAEPPASGDQP